MNKLIITADDYGMSNAVNEAIDEGIEAGLISATNVMTNMPYFEEAGKLKYIDNVSVGIHWTLSCGKPVLNKDRIATLVNKDGDFYNYSEFRERYRNNKINDDDIRQELKAQYELFKKVYGPADYWNTHQNVHVDFKIYRLFVDLARELKLDKMRSHQRIYVPASGNDSIQPLSWRIIEPMKSKLLDCWQENAHKKGISSPDGLIVCLNKSDENNLNYTFSNIKWKNKHIGEYVIHPATCFDSEYFGKIIDQRILEYKMFTNDFTKQILYKNNIQIVNYDALRF